jgi:hypothetical protein
MKEYNHRAVSRLVHKATSASALTTAANSRRIILYPIDIVHFYHQADM